MVQQKGGKRQSWTSDDLERGLFLLRSNLSLREVSKRCKISRRTLQRYVTVEQSGSQGVDNVGQNIGIKVKRLGRKTTLTDDEEEEFIQRIIGLSEVGWPLTPSIVRRYVFEFAELKNKAHHFSKEAGKAGSNWYRLFQKRHPNLDIWKAQNPVKAQKLNKTIVDDYFNKLEAVLDSNGLKHEPAKIFNLDEKKCQLNMHELEHVTVATCVSASRHAFPPMIIFKGSTIKLTYKEDLPHGTLVATSAKGDMTHASFMLWLDHFSKYKPAGKVLVIIDGAKCHSSFMIAEKAENLGVVLFCLPAHTSHELQPLDKSVFGSCQEHWDKTLNKYPVYNLNKNICKEILLAVWDKCMTEQNITSGFKATGIFPFDRSVIPDSVFAPSMLSSEEQPVAGMADREEEIGDEYDQDFDSE